MRDHYEISLTWRSDSHVLLTIHYKTSHWLSVGVIRCSLTDYKSAEHNFLMTVSKRERNNQRKRQKEHTKLFKNTDIHLCEEVRKRVQRRAELQKFMLGFLHGGPIMGSQRNQLQEYGEMHIDPM